MQKSQTKLGQSLAELVLLMIVLIPILIGVAYFGMAMYQGSLASEAIKEPLTHKLELANTIGAVGDGTLLGMAQGGAKGSAGGGGSNLDSVKQVAVSEDDSLLIGNKSSVTIPILGLQINFAVSTGLPAAFLRANPASGDSPDANPPVGSIPPNVRFKGIPVKLPYNPSCAAQIRGMDVVRGILGPDIVKNIYVSRKTVTGSTKFSMGAVMQLANLFKAECANPPGNTCADELKTLQPILESRTTDSTVPPIVVTSIVQNPPGRPEYKVTYQCTINDQPIVPDAGIDSLGGSCTEIEAKKFRPETYGMYIDFDGKFVKPPASFMDDCLAYKQAECMFSKAINLAHQIEAAYPDESSCR